MVCKVEHQVEKVRQEPHDDLNSQQETKLLSGLFQVVKFQPAIDIVEDSRQPGESDQLSSRTHDVGESIQSTCPSDHDEASMIHHINCR